MAVTLRRRNKGIYEIENPEWTDTGGGDNMDIEKYIDRLDQDRRDMEQRLRDDRQQMELRITEERRLSEERIEGRYKESMSKLDKSVENMENAKNWIVGVCIASVISIAGLVVAVLLAMPK